MKIAKLLVALGVVGIFLAACSTDSADSLLSVQAEAPNTHTADFTGRPGSLDFDGQLAQERGEVTFTLEQNETRQGNRIELLGDGRLLGRTNGASDNGYPFTSGSVGTVRANTWEFLVPFVTYRNFRQGNEYVRLATPKFTSPRGVKLVFSSNFVASPGDRVDDKVSCENGEFRANQTELTLQGYRYEIRNASGALVGRSNGNSDNGNLLGIACLEVRTSKVLEDGTVENVNELTPFVLIARQDTIQVFTPARNTGVKLVRRVNGIQFLPSELPDRYNLTDLNPPSPTP